MKEEEVRVELGPVATLTLNAPGRRNAMSTAMAEAFSRAVAEIRRRTDVRLVLLRGAGAVFSGGGDFAFIEERSRSTPAENRRAMMEYYGRFLSIIDVDVPTVAVIQGAAIGAALGLALACDLRLCADDATLGLNFVRLGIHPGMGTSLLVAEAVGRDRAADLLLTGRRLSGREAAALGLVTRAVPPDELDAEVDRLVEQLLRGAPSAQRLTKATLMAPIRARLAAALHREAAAQAEGFLSAELTAAIEAFRAKGR